MSLSELGVTIAEHLEGQMQWTLHRYELRALESHSFAALASALLSNGSAPLTFGETQGRYLDYTSDGVQIHTGSLYTGEDLQILWKGDREETIRLVLAHRSADPDAARVRDLERAERTRSMYESAVENGRRWLTDPTHPAYETAIANAQKYAAKRDEAEQRLTDQVQAMADYAARPLPAAPSPAQASLF